jgi:Tfp pilus assembly protein PilZ
VARKRIAKRIRRRMACELRAEGRQQRAIVLDFSRTGLFVQTSARLAPGTPVELWIQFEDQREPILVRATVARQKAVPPNLTSVAQGGVGLRILDAPRAYYDLLGEDGTDPGETRPPVPRAGPPAAARGAATRAAAQAAAPALPRFRVRIKQSDGPRSRVLDIVAETAERACAAALQQVGAGWEALGAERV